MCLIYSKKATEEIKKSNRRVFTYYKVYSLRTYADGTYSIRSAIQTGTVAGTYDIKPNGVFTHISDRDEKKLDSIELRSKTVSCGIHVYINKADAEQYIENSKKSFCWPLPLFYVPVKCFKNDLVAVGKWQDKPHPPQAVFMKIQINTNALIKAVNKRLGIK